jgi:zinc protease
MIETLNSAPVPFRGTEIHTLENGLKLIVKEDHTIPVVSIQAWAKCGAVNETPNIYGISHGLEHMVFKGTPTRSAGEITRAIESNGGAINAATQLETTHYYIDIPSYGADAALDVLGDTILNPTFPQEELERERLVILEEIHRRDDSPDATLWDEFISRVFQNTPYEIKVIGNEKTVSAMSRQDLLTYFHAHYAPSNKTVVVVGDFDKRKMVTHLTKIFSGEKRRVAPEAPVVDLKKVKPTSVRLKKEVQLTYFALGIPSVGLGHPDVVALDVLADVLSGGASSRFYQTLREERETMLSLSCDFIPFNQKGLFSFFGESLPEKGDKAIEELLIEIKNIKSTPIRADELSRAKARIKSEWLHGSETPHGQASTLGSLGVLDHLNLVTDYLPKIDALTIDDLMAAFETHLENRPFYSTRIDPIG